MVTGDNINTAIAIAKDSGIIEKDFNNNNIGKTLEVMSGK